MKLTPIDQVKAGDMFEGSDGGIYRAASPGDGRPCLGCLYDDKNCCSQCGGNIDFVIAAELPTVRVLEETARAFRDRLAQEIISAEVRGGRAKPDVYEMLAELEGVVGKAEVRM